MSEETRKAPGLKLGKIGGVPVYLSSSWFIITAVITVSMGVQLSQTALIPAAGAYLLGFACAVAIALAGLVHEGAHAMVVIGALAVVGLSLTSLGAKLQYQRGLAGNAFYALPHQAVRYPASATTIQLVAADGVSLAATVLAGGHRQAVVIVPSWRTNRDAFSVASLAQWLANSYDVLVLDPRGQGQSGGVKTPAGDGKHDILAAVAYMKGTGHERVGVLAEQDATYPAMLAGGMKAGIDSLALVAPTAHWGESLGQTGRLWDPRKLSGRLYWRVVAGLRLAGGPAGPMPAEAVRGVAPTPVLLLGNKAELGTKVDSLHLAAGEPKSMIVLGGAGKPTDWAHFAEYYESVKQWFAFSLADPGR